MVKNSTWDIESNVVCGAHETSYMRKPKGEVEVGCRLGVYVKDRRGGEGNEGQGGRGARRRKDVEEDTTHFMPIQARGPAEKGRKFSFISGVGSLSFPAIVSSGDSASLGFVMTTS